MENDLNILECQFCCKIEEIDPINSLTTTLSSKILIGEMDLRLDIENESPTKERSLRPD